MGFSKPVNIVMTEATDLTPILNQINVVNDNAVLAAQNAEQAYNMAGEAKTAAANAGGVIGATGLSQTQISSISAGNTETVFNGTGKGHVKIYAHLYYTSSSSTNNGHASLLPKITIDGALSAKYNGVDGYCQNMQQVGITYISNSYRYVYELEFDFDTSCKIELKNEHTSDISGIIFGVVVEYK